MLDGILINADTAAAAERTLDALPVARTNLLRAQTYNDLLEVCDFLDHLARDLRATVSFQRDGVITKQQ